MHKSSGQHGPNPAGQVDAPSGFISYMVAVIFITWMSGIAATHAVL